MKPISEDPFGSRLQDPVFANALDGYLAILVERARAIRPPSRRIVITPAGERLPASPAKERAAG